MSREGSSIAGSFQCPSVLLDVAEGRGGAARPLSSSAGYGTLRACGLGPYTFRAFRKDARALRARGLITLLGGHRAERRPVMADPYPTAKTIELLRESTARLRFAVEAARHDDRARTLERIGEDDPAWAEFLAGHLGLFDA
jgi:hypothetical protein